MKTANSSIRFPLRVISTMLLLGLVTACSPPGKPDPADRSVPSNEITDFARLYAANCAGCHGTFGQLGPAPPLNDPMFVDIIADDELRVVIRDGRPGTPMPAFLAEKGGPLTQQQIDVLAKGIKSHWGSATAIPSELPPYAIDKSSLANISSEAIQRGAQTFERACAGCHGQNGLGFERDGAMVGGINTPVFLGLISDQAIRRLIITGRSDLGMPNFRGTKGRSDDFAPLTNAEIDDLVALFAHWRTNSPQLTFVPEQRTPGHADVTVSPISMKSE